MDIRIPNLDYIWQEAEDDDDSYVLVCMHGRGGSKHDYEELGEILQIPRLNYLLLNAPDPFFDGYSWYDLPPSPLPGILRSRELLEDVMSELKRNGFDYDHIFLFGFSQGCLLTLEFGARFPHRLAGYIGMSGQCYDVWEIVDDLSPKAARGNWLITHGTSDEHFAIDTTKKQVAILRKNGMNIEFHAYQKGHEIDYENELPELKGWLEDHM